VKFVKILALAVVYNSSSHDTVFVVIAAAGLPDENGRGQILRIHTARMRDNGKLASDVDLVDLAAATKNFSGAEIEGLVRAAASTAMNRLVKVCLLRCLKLSRNQLSSLSTENI